MPKTSNLTETIQSPCIGVCTIDDSNALCQGCFRTLKEIQDWWDFSNAQKKTIMEEIKQRKMIAIAE